MKDVLIQKGKSIKEALIALNELSLKGKVLTLFVVDDAQQLLGSMTDGDIRRYLILGGSLDDCVTEAMHKDCIRLKRGDTNVVKCLSGYRNQGIKLLPVVDGKNVLVRVVDLIRYQSILPIDAVLMAGGKGERLRPLTEKTPKPLLKVGPKAIIDYNVDRLIDFGVRNISVTVNYLKEQIEEHFAQERDGVQVKCAREPKYLGTIGSVKFIEDFKNDTILVMNSDLFTNIDYEDFYLHFLEHEAEMSVAAVPYNVSVPYGIFDLDGRNIKGLVEKPTYNHYANAGIYLIRRSALELIPDGEFFNATDLIEALISQNKKVIRYPLNGTWIDIGNHQEYQKAKDLVKHLKF